MIGQLYKIVRLDNFTFFLEKSEMVSFASSIMKIFLALFSRFQAN